jgi:hypothetical protein
MGTREIWEVKAACVHDANPITTNKSQLLRKNTVTNVILPNTSRGMMEILTYILCCTGKILMGRYLIYILLIWPEQ